MNKLKSRPAFRASWAVIPTLIIAMAFVILSLSVTHGSGTSRQTEITIKAAGSGNKWINLQNSRRVKASFGVASQDLALARSSGSTRSVSLASDDFHVDGFADLVVGLATPSGGMLTIHRSDKEAFAPTKATTQAAVAAKQFPDPFLEDALAIEIPESPDFLLTGDFDKDGSSDIITAARGSRTLFLLTGDGLGGFQAAQPIGLSGAITAMIGGDLNQRDGAAGLAIGVAGEAGPQLLIYDSGSKLFSAEPDVRALPAEAQSLAIGRLDTSLPVDIAVLAGGRILVAPGRDTFTNAGRTQQLGVEPLNVEGSFTEMTVGDFIWDRNGLLEIAAQSQDGTISMLTHGDLDSRPITVEEARESRQRMTALREKMSRNEPIETADAIRLEPWKVSETITKQSSGGRSFVTDTGRPLLMSARLSGLPSDDLVFMDRASGKIDIMYREASLPGSQEIAAMSATRESVTLDADGQVAAVLPMRLNVNGVPGLVVLGKGDSGPGIIMPQAGLTFTVNSTADVSDPTPDGACDSDPGAGVTCTLREAIQEANADLALDTINIQAGLGPIILTILGNDAASAIGDLDINSTLTINGNNNTVSAVVNFGDKIFGTNQDGNFHNIVVSINNLTIQNGDNNIAFNDPTFAFTGGGFDIFLEGPSSSVTLTNCTLQNNRNRHAYGGGLNIDSSADVGGTGAAQGQATLVGCTFTNNQTMSTVNGEISNGGAINLFSNNHNVTMTDCTFNTNIVPHIWTGGGVNYRHSFGGTVIMNGCVFSGNSAGSRGGGIHVDSAGVNAQNFTLQRSVARLSALTNNTTGTGPATAAAEGGGIYILARDTYNTTLSKVNITGNVIASGLSVELGGAGMGVGDIGTSPFNMSFCRLFNNLLTGGGTGKGLRKANAGTVNAENNWWACNLDPSGVPCGAISVTGVGAVVDFNPWLFLNHTANPNPILFMGPFSPLGCPTTLTASFLLNSSGGAVSAANLDTLIGLPITFNGAVLGTISGAQPTIQANGTATATFTSGNNGGLGSANATVNLVVETEIITVNEPPTIICPANITTSTDPGVCTAIETFAPTVDGFPIPTVVCVPASGFAFPKGVTTVTCTASNGIHPDATCNTPGTAPDPTCTFTVTVNDTEPPAIVCPATITVPAEAGVCVATVTYTTPTPTDNCPGPTAMCSPASGTVFQRGTTTVTCTATDASGNTANCLFNVVVNDTQNPTITCPANFVGNTSPGLCTGIANFVTPTGADNCPGVLVACVPATGSAFPKGVTTVTCTATDTSGNTANCMFTVTINDTEAPVITCSPNVVVGTGVGVCSAVVSFTTNATDNCPGVIVACVPATGATFPKGVTTVACTATDTSSNTANCMFTVTVNDTEAPVVGPCPAPVSVSNDPGLCSAVVMFATPPATDNCPGVGMVACVPPSGSAFPKGVTTVICSATDASGNAGSCMFTVTVNDTEPPVITCPASGGAFAASSDCLPPANSAYQGTQTASYGGAQTFANMRLFNFSACNAPPAAPAGTMTQHNYTAAARGTLTFTPNPPLDVQANATLTIKTTFNNQSGSVRTFDTEILAMTLSGGGIPAGTLIRESPTLASTGQTTITTLSPSGFHIDGFFDIFTEISIDGGMIWTPADMALHVVIIQTTDPNVCTAVVSYPSPTVTDNCSGAGAPMCTPASGTTFPTGVTTVTCTVQDGAGNSSNCSFTITVIDGQLPAITCPANIVVSETPPPGSGAATVTYTTPTPTDNCTPPPSVLCAPASGSSFPVGTTTVTCVATDASGNTNQCTFTVQVNPLCDITCPSNIVTTTAPGTCAATVTYPPPTTTGACGTITCTPASGASFPKGVTTVTCTTTIGPSCSFTVTVNDNEAPVLNNCPANTTVPTDPNVCTAVVNYTPPTATDNCPGVGTPVCTPAPGFAFPKGVTTVTCTVSDAAGNPATPCTFTVTVNDEQPPSITCPANITQNTDPGQCAAIVTYTTPTATDNCPGVGTVTCTPASGASFPKGTTTVTCDVSDASKNTASCTFTVTINDTVPPTITCPANITVSTDPNLCSAVVNFVVTSSDNCPGSTLVSTPPSGSAFPKGTTTVMSTVTDTSGNSASCSFTVTVNDTQPPSIICPSNLVVPTAPNACSAVVNYTVTATDNCPGVTLVSSPPSGSTFPKGTTTVTATATDASGNTASCSFTVTVVDTQAPIITCPANITATPPNPTDPCVTVTYPTPTATDNCPGVTVACVPPSGTCFPTGTTTVTCTATDASGNTASCSFSVIVFNVCLQDNSVPSRVVLANSLTGDYRICCGGTVYTGKGTVNIQGNIITIQHNPPNRRVMIRVDKAVKVGTASLQSPPGVMVCTITDTNITNNTCVCQ